jgi:DNA-directed RNA polymerase subunit RPC12/RpoP
MARSASKKTVPCPRCKKDVPADGLQAGTLTRCPKCSMDFLVTGNSLGRDLDELEDYGLQTSTPVSKSGIPPVFPVNPADFSSANDQPGPRSDAEKIALYKQVMHDEELENRANEQDDDSEEEEEEEKEPSLWRPETKPPPGLYQSAVFPFLYEPESLIRMIVLGLFLFFVLGILWKATDLITVPAAGIASFAPWFFGMIFIVVGGVSGMGCFLYASASGMSIVCDTANGQKKVESWPKGYLFEWFQEAGYFFGAVFFSVLPGIPLGWLLRDSGIPQAAIMAVTVAFLFPLTLLAELDIGVIFFPASLGVWLSPFRARRAWLGFYLLTVPMVAFVAVLAAYSFQEGVVWLLFVACISGALVWFIYLRLLGRLAWYASGKAETSRA